MIFSRVCWILLERVFNFALLVGIVKIRDLTKYGLVSLIVVACRSVMVLLLVEEVVEVVSCF